MDPVSIAKIHGQGTPESAWRESAWLSALPLCDPDGLLRGCARVVVVSPHPDDEVLGCGGLLFAAHRKSLKILVIAVTDGEACYPSDPTWTVEHLRSARPRELATAIRELGVESECIELLHVPDGQVNAHESDLRERLSQLLRAGDCVLVTWHADGHPDHEATARATLAAAASRGASVFEFPVWAWHWLPSNAQRAPWPNALRYRISSAACTAKRRALRRFVSQLGGAGSGVETPILPPHVLARFQRDYEVLLHDVR